MRYLQKEELQSLVGKVLKFETWAGAKEGVLEKDGERFWLPFCGRVDALTVKISVT